MEKTGNSKELKKNAKKTFICKHSRKCKRKVKKLYTCEEKLNILQALKTMTPESVCAKFNVELALLGRWIENSVIINEELKRRKRNRVSSDSSYETDSSSEDSETVVRERRISQQDKEEILKDLKILSKQQFDRKYNNYKYLVHIVIVQKLLMKTIDEKNYDENSHNKLIDCNIKNYLNSSISFQKPNESYTEKKWIQMKIEIEDAQKLVKRLYNWYLQMQQKGIFVAEFMLKKVANRIAKSLRYAKFRATNTWLNLWYEIYNINVHTINKSAEYFDRDFLFENTASEDFFKRHVQEDWTDRQEEIDNVGEDLFFWYDDIIKEGKLVSDAELCARAEEVSIVLNDRPFFPDIMWLYEWKKQYNIQCAEMEWKLFKSKRCYLENHKNVKKHGKYSKIKKLKLDSFLEHQLSSSTSSIKSNVLNKTC